MVDAAKKKRFIYVNYHIHAKIFFAEISISKLIFFHSWTGELNGKSNFFTFNAPKGDISMVTDATIVDKGFNLTITPITRNRS